MLDRLQHRAYDIHGGHAGVFKSTDKRLAGLAYTALEEKGFHPFSVARAGVPVTFIGRLTPNPLVGPDLVLVPFEEVLGAEEHHRQELALVSRDHHVQNAFAYKLGRFFFVPAFSIF